MQQNQHMAHNINILTSLTPQYAIPAKIKPSKVKPWLVCLTAALFFYFEFFQINIFSVLDKHIMREFSVGAYELGVISSAYFYAIVFSLIPAGIILDFISTRKIILCSMVVAIAGTLWFANAPNINQLIYARLFVGIGGGAFCLLSSIKLATRWFPAQRLGLAIGMVISIGMLGGVMAQTPFALAIDLLGWRNAIVLDAIIGIIIFTLIWIIVEDYPPQTMTNTSEHTRQQLSSPTPTISIQAFVANAKAAAKRWPNWAAGIFASLLNLPIFLLGSLIGSLYLMQVYGYHAITASFINSMLYWGMLLGCPFFGLISDNLHSRKKPMLFGSIITFIAICYLINNHCSFSILLALFFIIGFGSSSQILSYPMVAERNPQHQVASGEGIAATLIMSGGAIFQPLLGWLIELNWNGNMLDNTPLYSLSDYHCSFWLMPIAIVVALAVLLPLREMSPNTPLLS